MTAEYPHGVTPDHLDQPYMGIGSDGHPCAFIPRRLVECPDLHDIDIRVAGVAVLMSEPSALTISYRIGVPPRLVAASLARLAAAGYPLVSVQ